MKKLLITALIPVFALATPAAMADEMTPSNVALGNQLKPIAASSLKAEVPNVDDGLGQNIDIVGDSLKYHSNLNPMPNQQVHRLQANVSHKGYGMNNMQNMNRLYPGAVNNRFNQYGSMPQNMGMQAYQGYNQPQSLASKVMNDPQMMKKAVGVVGAAALVGVFVKNGGLRGVTRSIGWNNKRQIRGAHIGY